jgi:hypothetical protein
MTNPNQRPETRVQIDAGELGSITICGVLTRGRLRSASLSPHADCDTPQGGGYGRTHINTREGLLSRV